MKKVRILDVDIHSYTEPELLERLESGVLVTPNVDHLIKLRKDPEFRECYAKASHVVCDSRILYFCSRLLPDKLPEAIPGSSFFTHYYQHHKDDAQCRIFLLGGLDGVAARAMAEINERVGRNIVVGAYSPSWGFENKIEENKTIYKLIEESGANVVVVGVGAPKQEKWIFANRKNMPSVKLWMALGATIDFEAGKIKRAPLVFRRLGLEWFYRFCMEPRRLFQRYFVEDMRFFAFFAAQLADVYLKRKK